MLIEGRVFKVEGTAMQRSWSRIGIDVLDRQHRAGMVGTEFTFHGFSFFFYSGSVHPVRSPWGDMA